MLKHLTTHARRSNWTISLNRSYKQHEVLSVLNRRQLSSRSIKTNHQTRTVSSTSSQSASPTTATAAASAVAERIEPSNLDEDGHLNNWMVNLRDEDWLIGPRKDTWYTGKHPNDTPGMSEDGTLTSLAMPRLDNVTRASTQGKQQKNSLFFSNEIHLLFYLTFKNFFFLFFFFICLVSLFFFLFVLYLSSLDYFDNTWTLYEMLFSGLNSEEYFFRPPPHGLRHPQIFYYGHTPCLYINKLLVSGVLKEGINPYFESILEIGVDEMLWDDMNKNDMVWPTVKEIHEYRQQGRNQMMKNIQDQILLNVLSHSFAFLFFLFSFLLYTKHSVRNCFQSHSN